jgi:hypothetical protein
MEQTTIKSEKREIGKKMEQTIESDQDKKIKYTFDGKSKEAAVEKLNLFILECKKKDFGRKITVSDIIAFAIMKLETSDIKTIQEQGMGKMDRLRKEFRDSGPAATEDDDFADWLISKSFQKTKSKLL